MGVIIPYGALVHLQRALSNCRQTLALILHTRVFMGMFDALILP